MTDFIRLQLKLAWGGNKNDSKKSTILTGIFGVLVIAVILVLVYFLASVLIKATSSVYQIALLFLTIIECVLTFMGITMQIRRLYRPNDLHITLRFPLTAFKQYIANILIIFINLEIYSVMFILPIMTVVFAAAGSISFVTVMGIIVGALFSALLPFAFSMIVVIPVMAVMSLLENRDIVKMLIFVAVIIIFFVLYNVILQMLADYFLNRGAIEDTMKIWTVILDRLDNPFNPFVYLCNLMTFSKAWAGFGIVLATFFVVSVIGFAVAKPVYNNVRKKLVDGVAKYRKHKSDVTDVSCGMALLKYNFKEILRTKAYAYFYLGIAIATPVMVFFCDRLVINIGKAQLGGTVAFGGSVLVISAFMAMISAFSAVAISIEGKNFYITKLVPISYRKQLTIKGALNLMVSSGALLISCIVLISLGYLSALQTVMVAIIELILALGLAANGLNLNLANPNLKLKANGEADEINITIMMVIGLVITIIVGALGLILSFMLAAWKVYLILSAIVIAYAVINVVIFIKTTEKRYAAIEF